MPSNPSYSDVLVALSPAERARVERSVMRMRVSGGVGCGPGVGSWLSQAVRSIVQPVANLVAPGTPATAAINTLFPPQAQAAAQQPAQAASRDNTPLLVLGGLGLGALILVAMKK